MLRVIKLKWAIKLMKILLIIITDDDRIADGSKLVI